MAIAALAAIVAAAVLLGGGSDGEESVGSVDGTLATVESGRLVLAGR